MNRTILNLDGAWSLWLAPHSEIRKRNFSAETSDALKASGFCHIDAEVPGNFELDMHRAGLLPDPYFGTNPLLCQKEENKHLWYAKTFTLDEIPAGLMYLRFEGIDTFAEIFLNGTLIGCCDNMLIEHEYVADGLVLGANEIVVHILPTAIKAREFASSAINRHQPYCGDSVNVRKAASMFGWDIMPRILSGGIWKSVSLVSKPENSIEEAYIATRAIYGGGATLNCFVRIHSDEDYLTDFEIVVKGKCKDSAFECREKVWSANNFFSAYVANPQLWWPRHAGEQNLYDVTVELRRGAKVCDTYTCKLGIRTIKLERTSVVEALPDGDTDGKFEFIVNGQKIFIMGTNWVPLDAFHSQDIKRLDRAFAMVNELGCNMIRCWGGNVYENDAFYDLCDQNGVMVWQDFGMGCAVYPQNEEFAAKLHTEAVAVIKRLRSHAALALWSGDNECDCAYAWGFGADAIDPNTNMLTREILKKAVLAHDPYRNYLPSSPYVDETAFRTGKPTSEEHLWGPRNYFKSDYYTKATARFASEMGYHGCNSPASLQKFIGKEHLWPSVKADGRADEHWTVHAASMETETIGPYEYRISLMNRQVIELFAQPADTIRRLNEQPSRQAQYIFLREKILDMCTDTPEGLAKFAKASQIFQAEAFKFAIEHFRIRKTTHGGLIWWNLIDGWPQISDAIVDYYYIKKLAYGYVRNSQQPLCMMFDEPQDGKITLYAANEFPKAHTLTYRVTRISDGKTVCEGCCDVEAHGLTCADSAMISAVERAWYLIEWHDENGNTGRNHYVTNIQGINYDAYVDALEKSQIADFEGF